jgi:hypothetical protein
MNEERLMFVRSLTFLTKEEKVELYTFIEMNVEENDIEWRDKVITKIGEIVERDLKG